MEPRLVSVSRFNDDSIFEKKEYFSLHIYSVEKGVVVHGHTYVTIHIYDDEGRWAQLAS